MNLVLWGFLASLGAGAMTGVGALPVLFGGKISRAVSDTLLGFAAGVMLAASFFSLIIPGLEYGRELYRDEVRAALVSVCAVLIGAGFVALLNEAIPHEHFTQGRQGPEAESIARIWLFVLAITIHNIPEGLAVGVGYGGGDTVAGTTLAIGIGLQNAPEGLAVAVSLLAVGYSRVKAFSTATLTGAVEPVAGLLGAYGVSVSQQMLPWALPFAAGAMLYVISHEIIPDTHMNGYAKQATVGLMIGLVVMMFLDVVLG